MSNDSNASGRIVIAGGTGFIGQHLARHLGDQGCDVLVLGRNPSTARGPWRFVEWDGRTTEDWAVHLDGAAAVVNLAGRSVDCIKTPDHCDEILRSRVESTLAIGAALRKVKTPPPVWAQMSTAHIYGDPPEAVCDEDSAFGMGLAPIVGQAWEAAYAKSMLPEMRQVILRTSFVIGREGGALPRLTALAKWGLGGRVGHGRQGISWLHIKDMVRLFERAIVDETMAGVYIATAPNPVSQTDFMRELRRALGMPIGLPAAEWMARIGAPLFMRTDPELALYGRYCVSRRLREEGFPFAFSEIGPAMDDLFG